MSNFGSLLFGLVSLMLFVAKDGILLLKVLQVRDAV